MVIGEKIKIRLILYKGKMDAMCSSGTSRFGSILKRTKPPTMKHKSFVHLFKGGGVEGRSPSPPIAMGEILQIPTSSGGEVKPSPGRFDRGEP